MFYFIVRLIVFLFFKIFFRFKVYGRDKVPESGAFILASNHVSYLDPPALACASVRALHFMARHDLFYNRVFGALIRKLNSFPVEREGAGFGALKDAVRRLRKGEPILIFPEGRRSQTGEIQAAQPGVGFLSLMSGAPILPAYVKGTYEALPKGARFIKLKPISVYFGDMVEPRKLKLSDDRKQACQELADYVLNEIKKLKMKGVA